MDIESVRLKGLGARGRGMGFEGATTDQRVGVEEITTRPREIDAAASQHLPLELSSVQDLNDAGRARWWRDGLRRRMLLIVDFSVALLVGAVAATQADVSIVYALAAPLPAILLAKLFGLYDADHRAIRHLTIDEVPSLTVWVGTVVAGLAVLIPGNSVSWELFVTLVVALMAVVSGRTFARALWRRSTCRERTLVVGEGREAVAIRRKVELFEDMHLELVDERPLHLGDSEGWAEIEHALPGIHRVVIAWSEVNPVLIEKLLELCREHQVKLSVVSPFRGRARPALRLSQVADLPILEYNTTDVPRSTVVLKRALDVALGSIALVVSLPLMVMIAAAIKIEDRGPVLFRQRRAGLDGEPFAMSKFRSMHVGADARLSDYVELESLDEPVFKMKDDPRVTRVGSVLRRFSLDELPQIWNVVRGEMSIVGPRPEETAVVALYEPAHRIRLELKPGLTGPMQVFGRGDLSMEERLAVEVDYLENLSVMRDFRILAHTLPVIVRGRGAY